MAVFPEGPATGAQQVMQPLATRVAGQRVRRPGGPLTSKSPSASVHYPDSGKVGLWSAGEGYQKLLPDGPGVDYWEGGG